MTPEETTLRRQVRWSQDHAERTVRVDTAAVAAALGIAPPAGYCPRTWAECPVLLAAANVSQERRP